MLCKEAVMNIEGFIEARKRKGISQADLVEGICTQATLSRFENQGNVPSLKILIQLCQRMDFPISELFPKVGQQHTETIEKMNEAEFLLITSEYEQAQMLLNQVDCNELSKPSILVRYYYINGFLMIYQNQDIKEILFNFDKILLEEGTSESDLYRLLAYTGIGMTYLREKDLEKAEFYFSKVLEKIYDMSTTNSIEETWRVLHIVFQCGVFYAEMKEFEMSNALLEYAVTICSDNHVTYYLARAAIQLAKNAMEEQKPEEQILELSYDARAYAKINRNIVGLKLLKEMEKTVLETE